jgi:hypothetical protein
MNPRLLRPISTTHPEAQAWRNAVIDNGGTVSGSTLNAVSRFCRSIDAAGIRSRFYRLSLLCGNNLNAALVPLYRSTAFGGLAVGNATDTNFSFVSGDYSESSGLTPTLGGGNHLDTGLTPDALPLAVVQAMHLAASHGPIPSSASVTPYPIGAANGGTDRHFLQLTVATSGNPALAIPLGKTNTVSSAVLPNGAQPSASWVGSRTSATSLAVYKNGAQDGLLTTSVTGIASYSRAFTVCRVNFSGTIIGDSLNFPHRHYSIGAGLTAAEVALYENALATFRTAIGRTA